MASDDKKAVPTSTANSTATEALLAETLGDVYNLSLIIQKLKEELPETSRSLAAQTNALLIAAKNYGQTLESLKNETAASISEKTKLGIEQINKASAEHKDSIKSGIGAERGKNINRKDLIKYVTLPLIVTNLLFFLAFFILK